MNLNEIHTFVTSESARDSFLKEHDAQTHTGGRLDVTLCFFSSPQIQSASILQVILTLAQTLGCTASLAPKSCFLVVRGGWLRRWWWTGGWRGGGALPPYLKVWVFDSVPYSLKLKNSLISNSFHMDVLWCGNCFSLYSVWCFAIGTLYSCSVLFSSSWLYNGSGSCLAGGRKLLLIWIDNLLAFENK